MSCLGRRLPGEAPCSAVDNVSGGENPRINGDKSVPIVYQIAEVSDGLLSRDTGPRGDRW
jgi:hypothetical protein